MTPSLAIAVRHGNPMGGAIVAHELAHFQQRDCDVFAGAFRYVELYILYSTAARLLYILDDPMIGVLSIPLWSLITVGFLFANRRLRRMSERSADLFAVLIGRGVGLIDALKRATLQCPRQSFVARLIEYHPPPAGRIGAIERALGLIRGEVGDVSLTRIEGAWVQPTFPDYLSVGLLIIARGIGLGMLGGIAFALQIAATAKLSALK
jgi:hypothetical protein